MIEQSKEICVVSSWFSFLSRRFSAYRSGWTRLTLQRSDYEI